MFENDKKTMDHMAMLHTVGSAIAPLIYDLKKKSSLVQFLKACEPIWEALDKDHKLCDSFVRHTCLCDQTCRNHPYGKYVTIKYPLKG